MQKDRAAEFRSYLATKAEPLLDAAHELEIMGHQFRDWAEELTQAGTSGGTPTCGPKDWYEPAEMLWCPIHHQLAVQCGLPPDTDTSTKAGLLAAAQCPACHQPWAIHKRESEGTVSCPVSTSATTPPSSPSGQTTPPTFRVEASCGCAIPMLLAWAAEPPRIGWELVCENHQPSVSLASVLTTAPAAERITLTSPKPESTSSLDWRLTAARARPTD